MNRERRRSESLTSPSRLARHLRRNALFREVRKLTRAGDVSSSCAARIMSSKDWVLLGRMFVMTLVSCGDADVTSSCVAKDASSKDWVLLGRSGASCCLLVVGHKDSRIKEASRKLVPKINW